MGWICHYLCAGSVDRAPQIVVRVVWVCLAVQHHLNPTIQGTFSGIQGTFGGIQGTFGGVQGTFGDIQGTFGGIQEIFAAVNRSLGHLGLPGCAASPKKIIEG